MSEHWTLWCDDCLEYGPDIMRSAGRTFRISGYWPRRHPDGAPDHTGTAADEWQAFMDQHGYHRLGLVHE